MASEERAEALYSEALVAPTRRRVEMLEQALALAPDGVRIWIALGDTFAGAYVPGAAERAAAEAGSAHPPGFAPGSVEWLLEDWRAGRQDDEADVWRPALKELQPAPFDAARARRVYEEAAEAAPGSPLPLWRLADLAWAADPGAAGAHLERVMDLDPGNALPGYERALLHFLVGEEDLGHARMREAGARGEIRFPLLLPTRGIDPLRAVLFATVLSGLLLTRQMRLRALARQVARAARDPRCAPQARAHLLGEGKRLARHVMWSRPRTLSGVIAGLGIYQVVADVPPEGIGGEERCLLRETHARVRAVVASLSTGVFHSPERREAPPEARPPWDEEAERVARILAESGICERCADA